MSTMEQWTATVCADLGLDPSSADLRAVLDLTRDVAHGVARPAAPLTAYLVGVAVGRGLALPDAAGRISALAAGWRRVDRGRGLTRQVRQMPGSGPGSFGVPSHQAAPPGYRTLTDHLNPGPRRPASPKNGVYGADAGRAKGGRWLPNTSGRANLSAAVKPTWTAKGGVPAPDKTRGAVWG